MNVTVVTEMRLEKMRPETKLTNAFLLLQCLMRIKQIMHGCEKVIVIQLASSTRNPSNVMTSFY